MQAAFSLPICHNIFPVDFQSTKCVELFTKNHSTKICI
jgi:hypothetical protein